MKRPKLIPDWKRAWRFFSMQAMAIATALQGAWVFLPDDLRTNIPTLWVASISIAILLLGILGRLLDQK